MVELSLLFVSLVFFAAGCVGLGIYQERQYKARFDQTEEAEENKKERVATLNAEIERSNRGKEE